MSVYQKRIVEDLLKLEGNMKSFLKSVGEAESKKEKRVQISKLKTRVSKQIVALPTSDSALSALRKTLTPINQLLDGLETGIDSKNLPTSDLKKGLLSLEKKFIPAFRAKIDELVTRIRAGNANVSDVKVYNSDQDLLTAIKKIPQEITKFVGTYEAGVLDSSDRLDAALKSKILFLQEILEKIPTSPQLDSLFEAVMRLSKRVRLIQNKISNLNTFNILPADLQSIKFLIGLIKTETVQVAKDSANGILDYEPKIRDISPDDKVDVEKSDKAGSEKAKKDMSLIRTPDEHLREQLADIKAERASLPATMSSSYGMVRCSVVAIFNSQDNIAKKDRPMGPGAVSQNFSRKKVLESLNLKHLMIDDYLIIQDQTCLALNKKKLLKELGKYVTKKSVKKKEGDTKNSKPILKVPKGLYLEMAKQSLELVNEKGSKKYALVSQNFTVNPRNPAILLFWIMPAPTLNTLIQRGWNKMTSWSLPYDLT